MAKKLTREQRQNIVDCYNNGMSGIEICKNFKHSTATVAKVLREEGIKVIKGRDNRWYEANYSYLDELDCANKFWFLGYFYADGYVSMTTNKISIDSIDKEILEKCRILFDSNRPLQFIKVKDRKSDNYNRYNAWSFRLENANLHQKIIDYGCDNYKSYNAKMPWELFQGKEQYIRDFVRGLYDGDGGINYKYDKDYRGVAKICGTPQLIQELTDFLEKELECKFFINKGKITTWYFETTGMLNTYKFLKWIYYDNVEIYMDRKYQKSIQTIQAIEEKWQEKIVE